MQNGKVVRFDDVRGYGFLAPEDGGEDVFVHANDLRESKNDFAPGAKVSFDVEHGERGPKASGVRIVERAPAEAGAGNPTGSRTREENDDLCDLLSASEFRSELTEALLQAVPSLTAAQLLQVRQRVTELARAHNWIES